MGKALIYDLKLPLSAQKKGTRTAIPWLRNKPERKPWCCPFWKKAENYLAVRIPEKISEAVMAAMEMLKAEYGDRFAQVFKTITVDSGSEFADFSQCESWGAQVFFCPSLHFMRTGAK